MLRELLFVLIASLLLVWSAIVTFNIPYVDNKWAQRVARVFCVALVYGAMELIVHVR